MYSGKAEPKSDNEESKLLDVRSGTSGQSTNHKTKIIKISLSWSQSKYLRGNIPSTPDSLLDLTCFKSSETDIFLPTTLFKFPAMDS